MVAMARLVGSVGMVARVEIIPAPAFRAAVLADPGVMEAGVDAQAGAVMAEQSTAGNRWSFPTAPFSKIQPVPVESGVTAHQVVRAAQVESQLTVPRVVMAVMAVMVGMLVVMAAVVPSMPIMARSQLRVVRFTTTRSSQVDIPVPAALVEPVAQADLALLEHWEVPAVPGAQGEIRMPSWLVATVVAL